MTRVHLHSELLQLPRYNLILTLLRKATWNENTFCAHSFGVVYIVI